MSTTPWSWQHPPFPETHSVPGYKFVVPRDKIWHRTPWGVEPLFAISSHLQPGFSDILFSCQVSSRSTEGRRPLSLQAVKEAVRLLRFQRPTIASRLAWPARDLEQVPAPKDARLIYEAISSEEMVDAWVDEVVFDRSDANEDASTLSEAMDRVMRDVGRGFDSPPSTLFHVHVIIAPDGASAGLIVRGSHALVDAFGLTSSINQLIANIAAIASDEHRRELVWGDELKRLVGSGVDYAIIPWSLDEEERDDKMLRAAVAVAKEVKVTSGLPIPKPLAHKTTTTILVRSLTGDILRDIISAARAQKCTLYPVLFAAMVITTLRVNPPSTTDGLAVPLLFTPANLRHKGIIDHDSDVLSALSYNVLAARDLGRFLSVVPSLDGLWTIAKEIGSQLQEQQGDIKRSAVWIDKFIASLTSMMEGAAKARGHKLPTLVTPRVSSMGILDKYLMATHEVSGGGILDVSDPVITVCVSYGSPLFGCMVGLHAYTWRDTFYMCFSFPEAFMGTPVEQKTQTASVWTWSEEFLGLLQSVASCAS